MLVQREKVSGSTAPSPGTSGEAGTLRLVNTGYRIIAITLCRTTRAVSPPMAPFRLLRAPVEEPEGAVSRVEGNAATSNGGTPINRRSSRAGYRGS